MIDRKQRHTEWMRVRRYRLMELLERDEAYCHYCHRPLDNPDDYDSKLTIDHIVPVVMNGNDELCNLVLACKTCNSQKRDASYEDFVKRNNTGFLITLDDDRKRAKWLVDFEAREFQRGIASNYTGFTLNEDEDDE